MKKSVKNLLQIILLIGVLGLAYVLYEQIMTPLRFNETQAAREKAVVERLKDIRTAQRAYKQKYAHYTPSFDTLINFIKTDSMVYEVKMGSEDDSVAVAQGKVKTTKLKIAVKDTIFTAGFNADELRVIPFSDGKDFIMNADTLVTESKVVIPVFEAKAPYKLFLGDLDEQELINLLDRRESLEKYKGLTVGAIDKATNDAGNWE